MTSEEMERAIEFLMQSQTKNSADIAFTNEVVNNLAAGLKETGRQMEADRRENREQLEAYRRETREQLEAYRQETRKAINNLIIANEVTRDLAEKVARLAISTSQRVTVIETGTEG